MNITNNLVPFASNDGLELVIETNSGETFASQSAVARMCEVSETAIRKWITSNQIDVIIAQINTQTGLKTSNLLPESSICKALAKYNPNLLIACAHAGLRVYLHKLAGYQVTSTATKALPESDKPTLAEIAQFADVVFRGTDVHPNVQSAIKLNAIEKHYPQMSGMCADTRKQLPVVVDRIFLNVTDLAKLYNEKYGYLTANKTERGEAIALNKLLIDRGYQTKNPSGNPSYLSTEIGKKYSETMLDTAPGHGKSILTLKWCENIVDVIG